MIRYALRKSVHWMESMAGVWGRHDPFMMRLMQGLIDTRVVQPSVYPVDEEVGKEDEEGELEDVVKPERSVGRRVVQFGVPLHLANEEWNGEYGHYGKGNGGLLDLKGDLILEIFGVGEGGMVENEEVR